MTPVCPSEDAQILVSLEKALSHFGAAIAAMAALQSPSALMNVAYAGSAVSGAMPAAKSASETKPQRTGFGRGARCRQGFIARPHVIVKCMSCEASGPQGVSLSHCRLQSSSLL